MKLNTKYYKDIGLFLIIIFIVTIIVYCSNKVSENEMNQINSKLNNLSDTELIKVSAGIDENAGGALAGMALAQKSQSSKIIKATKSRADEIYKERQQSFLRNIKDKDSRKSMELLLNEKSPRETVDKEGNILTTINNKKITLLGFEAMKSSLLARSIPTAKRSNIEEVQESPEYQEFSASFIKEFSISQPSSPKSSVPISSTKVTVGTGTNVASSVDKNAVVQSFMLKGYCCKNLAKNIAFFSINDCINGTPMYILTEQQCKQAVAKTSLTYVKEDCTNNIDDDQDEKVDCDDENCNNYIKENANKQDSICYSGKWKTCGSDLKLGSIVSVANPYIFDLLCIKDGEYNKFISIFQPLPTNKNKYALTIYTNNFKFGKTIDQVTVGTIKKNDDCEYVSSAVNKVNIDDVYKEVGTWKSCCKSDQVKIEVGESVRVSYSQDDYMICKDGKWLACESNCVEDCFNNVDDNLNGKTDCEDAYFCSGKNVMLGDKEVICLNGKKQICGSSTNPIGTVIETLYGSNYLCMKLSNSLRWINANSVEPGTKKVVGNCEYLTSFEMDSSSFSNYVWRGCECGSEEFKAIQNTEMAGYTCKNKAWIPTEKVVSFSSTLNLINPLFEAKQFNKEGFMYYSAELYEEGTFPFLPYLTEPRDQGARGTCWTFAEIGANELLLLNRPDFSEQNRHFMGIKPQIDGGNYVFTWSNTGLYPGIENEWPYNEGGCENGMYSVDGITYPCSDTFHNGIPLQKYDDSGLSTEEQVKLGLKYDQYSGAKGTTAGGCVIGEYIDTNGLSADEKVILLAYYLNQLKKPITFTTVVSGVGYPGDNGFLTNEFFKNGAIATFGEDTAKNGGGGHKLLFVGFIPREFIPEKVKMHHDFVPNEDYFIIKNSWGKYFGDNGFLYATASQVVKYTYEYYAYEYDTDSKYFPGCDSLRSKVVYDKVTEQTVKAKLGYN